MPKHKCTNKGGSCLCSMQATEPNEKCPIHGYPDPRRCVLCGKWIPLKDRKE